MIKKENCYNNKGHTSHKKSAKKRHWSRYCRMGNNGIFMAL